MTTTQTAPATTAPATFATRTLSTISLIGGIASIVFGQTVLLPIVAIVLGILGYRQEPSGRSFAIWGIVLSVVALCGWALVGIVGFAFAAPWILLGMF